MPGYMVDKVRRLYEWGLITKTADRSVAGSSNQIIEELTWSIEDGYLRDPTESISEVDDFLWGRASLKVAQFHSAVALMDEYQERFFERGCPGIEEARQVLRVRSG
ncbi:MAG: hypothetical protein AAF436_21565 [Myxococcota bacterium]